MTDSKSSNVEPGYNARYSMTSPIMLGDLENLMLALGVVDDYMKWLRYVQGWTLPGAGDGVCKQVEEARQIARRLYDAAPNSRDETTRIPQPESDLRAAYERWLDEPWADAYNPKDQLWLAFRAGATNRTVQETTPAQPPECICKPVQTNLANMQGWYSTDTNCPIHGHK